MPPDGGSVDIGICVDAADGVAVGNNGKTVNANNAAGKRAGVCGDHGKVDRCTAVDDDAVEAVTGNAARSGSNPAPDCRSYRRPCSY